MKTILRSYKIRAILLVTLLFSCWSPLRSQSEYDFIKDDWLQFTDAPNFLYHHIASQAYDMLKTRSGTIGRLTTPEQWKERQRFVKETLTGIVGPFPEKTPLNARVTRVIRRDSLRIEHVIFESQPGFYVTSTLFIPGNLKKNAKAPAILYCSGHSADGYRSPVYQHTILNLVKKGFVVFAFDPVGQGERLEYYDVPTGKSAVGGPTTEHSYPGTQAFITGSSQARYMIWDGIRAVDYLCSRKEVDQARIGITGRSGGGTQSAYIAAMDERIYAAAPECYLTTFTRLFQTMGNQDAEQNLFNEISRGLDLPDLIEVRAPKPLIMITTSRDIFSIQGAIETEREASVIYRSFGAEGSFSRVEDDTSHASTKKNREAMYAFFRKHLDNPGESEDEPVTILGPDEIKVTATGQLSTSLGGETVFSLNRTEAEKLESRLEERRKDPLKMAAEVQAAARKLSGYTDPVKNDEPVLAGRIRKNGYSVEKYFVSGEGNYIIPYLLFLPDRKPDKCLITLNQEGKSAAAGNEETEWLLKNGFAVLAPDLIGTGETGPGVFRGDAYIEGGSHNLFYGSVLIGRSIVAIRSSDVVRLGSILKQRTGLHDICGVARKEMAPVLVHAAMFDNSFKAIALLEPCISYFSIVENRFYNSSYIPGVVPGALKEYDLPDAEAALAPRTLVIADPADGNGKPSDTGSENTGLNVVRNAYKSGGADSVLSIIDTGGKIDPAMLFGSFLK